MDGIVYHPNGTITVEFDDNVWTFARPRLKTYRWLSEKLEGSRSRILEVNSKIAELTRQLEEDGDTDQIRAEIDRLNEPLEDYFIPILRETFEKAADKPLPDNADDWPPWLVLDMQVPYLILAHWRTVPKAPGVAGTN
jgi:hypothetical protein